MVTVDVRFWLKQKARRSRSAVLCCSQSGCHMRGVPYHSQLWWAARHICDTSKKSAKSSLQQPELGGGSRQSGCGVLFVPTYHSQLCWLLTFQIRLEDLLCWFHLMCYPYLVFLVYCICVYMIVIYNNVYWLAYRNTLFYNNLTDEYHWFMQFYISCCELVFVLIHQQN